MIAMARKATADWLLHESWWLVRRYAFPMGFGGYVFWIWEFSALKISKPGVLKALCVFLLLVNIGFCRQGYWRLFPGDAKNHWTENAKEIDLARQGKREAITIPIEEEGWSVTIGKD
jgi:hypothetical protein